MSNETRALHRLIGNGIEATSGRVKRLSRLLGELSKYHAMNLAFELVHHGGNPHRLDSSDRARKIGTTKKDGHIMEIWAVW